MSLAEIPEGFRERAYRLRRRRNWILVGLLYAFFYMSRYNFSAMAKLLMGQFGWSPDEIGLFEFFLPLTYGLSVVINAPFADRLGGRRAFLVGAVGVVCMNTAFAVFPSLFPELRGHALAVPLCVIWSMNAYFQTFGALSIVKVNAQWFHTRERGTFAGIFGVLIRLGLWLGTGVAPWLGKRYGWQCAFLVPAVCVALMGIANGFFVRERPVDAGFEDLDTGDASSGERPRAFDVLRRIFGSRTLWLIAIASMMIGLVRRSCIDAWWPLFFNGTLQLDADSAGYQAASLGIMIMGIAGGFTLGIASDWVFDRRRAPVVFIGFTGMAVCLALFAAAGESAIGNIAALVALSFFVNGAHGMIGGAASMDFGGRQAAATAAGLFDGMQYLASVPVGRLVPYVTKTYGWTWWKLAPIPAALVGALVMLKLWSARPGRGSH